MTANSSQSQAIELFLCYAHEDEKLLHDLEKQLSVLKKKEWIEFWYDRQISPGVGWEDEIRKHLDSAQIILLLISPDFIASDYCGTEMKYAMERQQSGKARVIPVILRDTLWQETPLSKLQALPKDGIPVVSKKWHNQDEALLDVAQGIKKIIIDFRSQSAKRIQIQQYLSRRKIIAGGGIFATVLVGGSIWKWQSDLNDVPHLIFTYTGHSNRVESVKYSHDSLCVASAGQDVIVQIWDILTGEHVVTYRGHTQLISEVAWSPNNKLIASSSIDHTVHVWNAETEQVLFIFTKHTDRVIDVAWSPNGAWITSASLDTTVQVFDATSGASLHTYRGHTKGVNGVAWASNNTYIASVGDDSYLHVWDAKTGHTIFPPLYFPFGRLFGIAWSPDGRYISLGGNTGQVSVVDLHGNVVSTYLGHTKSEYPDLGHTTIRRLVWSPDGKRVASACFDKTVQVWDAFSGKNIFTYNRHTAIVVGLDWSHNGKYIASGSYDTTVQVWNAPNP